MGEYGKNGVSLRNNTSLVASVHTHDTQPSPLIYVVQSFPLLELNNYFALGGLH